MTANDLTRIASFGGYFRPCQLKFPTAGLRFVVRDLVVIMQHYWTGEAGGEWRDVPLCDEVTGEPIE